jgi:hypothetical protein
VSEIDDRVYGKPQLVGAETRPLVLHRARLPDPATIPPRKWLLGTQALRGYVSVLVAPGGTGKSAYAMTAALSLATGQKMLGIHVWERVNVAVINEDPMEELERRLAALIIRHRVDDTEVEGRYFLNSMEDDPVIIATKGPDGFTVVHPSEAALTEQIITNQIGFLVVDPFAESHTLEENSNPDMIAAASAWRRIARRTSSAIFLVHHVRKGANEGGIDAARGAKGLTDSARVGLLMQVMTETEAESLNIPTKERYTYVRIDDAKTNLSQRTDEARWFKLDTVELNNPTRDYPHGDKVVAIVPWRAPKLFSTTTPAQINEVLDLIAAGPEQGVLFGGTARGGSERWAGKVIRRICDVSDMQAQAMLDAWLSSGLLFLSEFKNPHTRKVINGLRVDNSKRP